MFAKHRARKKVQSDAKLFREGDIRRSTFLTRMETQLRSFTEELIEIEKLKQDLKKQIRGERGSLPNLPVRIILRSFFLPIWYAEWDIGRAKEFMERELRGFPRTTPLR